MSDSDALAAVINELNRRRVESLSASKYLDSKRIGDLIDSIKRQLHQGNRQVMYEENLRQLTERYRKAVDSLEVTRRQWRDRKEKFQETCESEWRELEGRHAAQGAELEAQWNETSTQRKFTKRSARLLQQRAVEKYMVLAGQLEAAEEVKRVNRENERQETQRQYQNMMDSFENAREKLATDQNSEMAKLKSDQDLKRMNLLKDEEAAIAVCQKRAAATQRKLDDESDLGKFAAKKFKKCADRVLPTSVFIPADDLARLLRAKGLGRPNSSVCEGGKSRIPGLELPPLCFRRGKRTRGQVR
jgi:hypothetical protein